LLCSPRLRLAVNDATYDLASTPFRHMRNYF
jgi:hypothetical protein